MRFKKKYLPIIILIMSLALAMSENPVFSADGKTVEMRKLLPQKVENYRSDGKDQFYDRQTAFRHMDGAAELYRSYAFKLLMVRRYIKEGAPTIIVELFDMGSSEDAYGVFSFETEGEDPGIGQGSGYGGGLLRLWKGKYFVNVYGEQDKPPARENVLSVGGVVAQSIKKDGQTPKLLNHLPEKGLLPRSIRYFHDPHNLNHHYFVSHENILFLGEKTNAVLAAYSIPGKEGKTFLLMIEYPTRVKADSAFLSFVKAYMPGAPLTKAARIENGKWTMAQVYQKHIIIVFDALSQKSGEALIGATRQRLQEK
jgi:hypothetical protein